LRRGDLTRRKGDYQTRPSQRQPLAAPLLIATIHRDKIAERRRNKGALDGQASVAAQSTSRFPAG
jgi:hypothetical protein